MKLFDLHVCASPRLAFVLNDGLVEKTDDPELVDEEKESLGRPAILLPPSSSVIGVTSSWCDSDNLLLPTTSVVSAVTISRSPVAVLRSSNVRPEGAVATRLQPRRVLVTFLNTSRSEANTVASRLVVVRE